MTDAPRTVGRPARRAVPQAGPPAWRHVLRLSGRGLAFVYILACCAPLALALGRRVAPHDDWGRLAAALGLSAMAAMAVQFVTSGRFSTVSGRVGIDRIMAFHKIAALWVLVALILHPLAYLLPTWLDRPDLAVQRGIAYLTLPQYRTGVVALGALVLLVLTSVLRDRLPWRYEIWRASHVVLGLIAVSGGLHHAVTAGRYSASGPVAYLWWGTGAAVVWVIVVLYGWRWAQLHRQPWQLAHVTRLPGRMWELDIQPAPHTRPMRYEAGQFVWMTDGRRRFPLFDHPFSIADSPRRPGLSLIVKEAGDYTNLIGTLPRGITIGIDGPYGEFTLDQHKGHDILLLAGGVGIAPIMGLLRDLVATRDRRKVRLGYAAGKTDNFACLGEIEAARAVLDLEVMLASEEGAPGWTGEVGYLTPDRLERLLEGLDRSQTVALICGPGPMVTAVSDALLDLGLPMDKVVYERFDYSGGTASRQDRRRSLGFLGIAAVLAGIVAAAVFVLP